MAAIVLCVVDSLNEFLTHTTCVGLQSLTCSLYIPCNNLISNNLIQNSLEITSLVKTFPPFEKTKFRPSDTVREKNKNCALFWRPIVREKKSIVRDCAILQTSCSPCLTFLNHIKVKFLL